MKKLDADSPETKSADIVAGNTEALKALFPEAFTEGRIDFEVLKGLLGAAVDERDEKYVLNWHGKRRARQMALTPSTGTLLPCPDESVDWDTTQNLLIEGDNLEVLKLLQKSYAGKVKLIYIDPPYNTGKDFVYPDDFSDNIKNYLDLTGQVESGRKISSNTEASGRFHTDWLNMIYPRLKLARNLLQDDGLIFISIDDGELGNLNKICDEIYGEENFICNFVWEKRTNRENRKMISSRHDYIVCYCKNVVASSNVINMLPMSDEAMDRYTNPDNDPRGPWKSDPASAQAGHGTKGQFYVLTAPNGRRHDLQSGRCWVYTEEVMNVAIRDGRIWFGKDGNGVPRIKTYLNAKERGLIPESIWFAADTFTNESAKNTLKELFDGEAVFDTPKPLELIQQMLRIGAAEGLVIDFFAGSGATGHAVLAQNAADGIDRRYILVQLPEPLDPENSDQATAASFCKKIGRPRNIAELTKERLRRASTEIKDENPMFAGDTGFRVFKLARSNIRAWEPDAADLEKSLLTNAEHLVRGRSGQDVLYELLLKLGLDLCVPIKEKMMVGKAVYSIGGGALIVCLADGLTKDVIEALSAGIVAWREELAPAVDTRVVFKDSGFADDIAKTNMAAILNQNGISDVRSL